MSRYPLPCAVASLFLFVVGCSSAPEADPTPDEPHVERAFASTTYLNPCDPAWQLPTSYRGDPSGDEVFRAFEDELAAGGSLWIGSRLPEPHRAIVRVDVYASATKKLVDSHLWYLAAIPIDSSRARAAVDVYARKPPVDSKVLGYCLNDKTFLPFKAAVPPNHKIVSEITEYDPRCVCIPSDGLINIVE